MKIAIAGYGVEGEANYRYWSADASNDVVIIDERLQLDNVPSPDAMTILGEGAFGRLKDFDLVVRTAGLAPRKISTKGKIWSATNEFFAKCPAPIIGVTGSKGKGTVSSLIAAALEAAGRKVWLIGNIGVPSLDVLSEVQPSDIVVYELSSFQLWDLEKSPQTAVVLHIEQEHLNVHEDMDDYVSAKANIARHQSVDDLIIYNRDNSYASGIAEISAASKIAYPDEQTAHVKDGHFYYGDQELFEVNSLQLKGNHNQQNALAAIDAVWPYVADTSAIGQGMSLFKGLPHRLAFVQKVDGVDYYDDSIATTPSSAIAALRAFDGQHKVIILGGSTKGADFTELAQEMSRHEAAAVLTGDEADNIAASFNEAGFGNYKIIKNAGMSEVVAAAREASKPGGVVLLSPAAASFDSFRGYEDRGDQFIDAVRGL